MNETNLPQPPALGGELKCWSCKAEFNLQDRQKCDGCCWKCGVEIELDDYIAPLLAEVDRLKALSVENIMIEVVPGHDGMGEEVYAKSVADIQKVFSKFVDDNEALEAERDTLKANLTKARELLDGSYSKFKYIAGGGLFCQSTTAEGMRLIHKVHQPAPAAKDGAQ